MPSECDLQKFRDNIPFILFGYRNYYSDKDIFDKIRELQIVANAVKKVPFCAKCEINPTEINSEFCWKCHTTD